MKNGGILYTDGKQVLLLKKRDNGSWGLPGGTAKKGETDIATARRETKEECGVLTGTQFDKLSEKDWITFLYKIDKPFKCRLSKEHTDWKWFNFDELKKINLHPKFKQKLHQYIKLVQKEFGKDFKEWFYYEVC